MYSKAGRYKRLKRQHATANSDNTATRVQSRTVSELSRRISQFIAFDDVIPSFN